MSDLRVALFHRDSPHRWVRTDGGFSYPVSGLSWEHFAVSKLFTVDLSTLRRFDVVWLDDGKYKGHSEFVPSPPRLHPPFVVCYALYPTLTAGHFRERVNRARINADGVLLDHDDLDRWRAATGLPVARCAYATDETVYVPKPKDIDVGFYCVWEYNRERPALDAWLRGHCGRHGWVYASTQGEDRGRDAYADMLGRTKVVIHMNRTPATRAPRLFDAAACGCAVLANPVPPVSGEEWVEGAHYACFRSPSSPDYAAWVPEDVPEYGDVDCWGVAEQLDWLLGGGERWRDVAETARAMVLARHTWRARAKDVRLALSRMFPALAGRKG